MAEVARVQNLEALKKLKYALQKFQETINVALTDAESDMQRTTIWLETEQKTYWVAEHRKRHEAVEKAKQAVREKQLYKDSTGYRSSAVDEMKVLQAAQRRLVEAEQKVAAVKKYIPKMQKDTQIYRGGVQRFASTVQHDLPVAITRLDNMLATLEAYVSLGSGGPPDVATSAAGGGFGPGATEPSGGMARPADAPVPAGPQIPRNFPKFDAPKVALTYVERTTGEPRTPSGDVPTDGASTFELFPTADDARRFAAERVEADPRLQCNIHDPAGHLLHLVKAGDPPPPPKPYAGD